MPHPVARLFATLAATARALLMLLLLALSGIAAADAQRYAIYLDTDLNPATGCTATATDASGTYTRGGFEYRFEVSVDDTRRVGPVLQATCANGSFAAPSTVDARLHPLAQSPSGTSVDYIEFALPRAALKAGANASMAVVGAGDFIVGPDGASLLLPLTDTTPAGIPALSPAALLALSMLVALLAWHTLRRGSQAARAVALLLMVSAAAGLAWAGARISFDGSASGWQGVAALAQDPAGDQLPGTPDLLAVYATAQGGAQGGEIAFRLDAASGRNRPPRIIDAAYLSSATTGTAWQAQLSATDPDGDALRWSLTAQPGGASIGADGAISWTPAQAGTAQLTARVTDSAGAYAERQISVSVTASVEPGDGPPQFRSSPNATATVGQAWRYAPVIDSGTPPLTLSLAQAPAGMELVSDELRYTPSATGSYSVELVARDNAGRSATQRFTLVVSDTTNPPPANVSDPLGARLPQLTRTAIHHLTVGTPWQFDASVLDADGDPLDASLISTAATPAALTSSGAQPLHLAWTPGAADVGEHAITLTAQDSAGRTLTLSLLLAVTDPAQIPADPVTRATALAEGGITPFSESTAFLYTGPDPIQQGVAPGTIVDERAAVLRGLVRNRSGQPLAGVTVTVWGHPEYGHTQTRADGWFDLAVNGGGILTLDYAKPGYIRAQRKLDTPWRDYAIAEDVVLLDFDARATPITLGHDQWQAGQGSPVSDERGNRTLTALFPPNLGATLRMPDGSTRTLNNLTFRATEFTVGEDGPDAMPGELPISVGYTYAVELSADEAVAAGATHIEFDRPVPTYLDNFLDFPVGEIVPSGWYDYERAAWIGSDNGRVVRILAIEADRAVLQVGAEARAATAQELAELGIADEELAVLAKVYGVGKSLWRAPVDHFTTWDWNYSDGAPPDADIPPEPEENADKCPPGANCCPKKGCDVYPYRNLGQVVDIPGSPFRLHYRSDRAASRPYSVPLLHKYRPVPGSLESIEARVDIAGRRFRYLAPRPFTQGMQWDFQWDGIDAYGRDVLGAATARVRVTHRYPKVIYPSYGVKRAAFEAVSARMSGSGFFAGVFEADFPISRYWTTTLEKATPDVALSRAGGWALEGLPVYDPSLGRLYRGGGDTRTSESEPLRFEPVATLDGGAAHSAVSAPEGGFFAVQPGLNRIVRIERNGALSVVAGGNGAGAAGDGGPAASAQLSNPGALALGSDGSLYFADQNGTRIRRIDPAGNIATIAGAATGSGAVNAPGEARLARILVDELTVDRDGNVFYGSGDTVHQVSPAGGLTSAITRPGLSISSVAANPSGGVWVATNIDIAFIAPGGDTSVLAGGGRQVQSEGPGIELHIRPAALVPDRQGGLYFSDGSPGSLWRMRADGYLTSLDEPSETAEYRLLQQPDSDLWQIRGDTLGVLADGLSDYGAATYTIAREDGLSLDVFDRNGRPLEVVSSLTGARVLRYEYAGGYPVRVIDADGNTVTFERDGSGRLMAIVGVNGERTALTHDANGMLAQVDAPGGVIHRMRYGNGAQRHLLAAYADPNGHEDRFEYDAKGRLSRNINPAGGGWRLESVDGLTPNPFLPSNTVQTRTHILTSAEGREYRYTSPVSGFESEWQRVTAPDGLTSDWRVVSNSGDWERKNPDGTIEHGKPERGWRTTDGTSELRRELRVVGSDGTLGTAVYSTRYRNGVLDYTTPVGRAWQAYVDELLRPITLTVEGLTPVSFSRDGTGRLTHVRASGDAGAPGSATYQTRETVLEYHGAGNGKGHLASLTDALGARTAYAYDATGRLTETTLPDGRQMHFDYDQIGNLTALTTPAGITHRFRFDAIHQPTGYDAPASATDWHYDRDRFLVGVTRPGGESLTFTRDIAGRVTRLAHGAGQVDYGYDAFGRLESADAGTNRVQWHRTDRGVTSLVTGVEWQGDINGRVDVIPERILRLQPTRLSVEAAGTRVELKRHIDGADRPVAISTDTSTSTPGLAVSGDVFLAYAPQGAVSDVIVGRYPLSRTFNSFGETVREMHSGPYTHPELEAMRAAFVASAGALKAELLAQVHGSGSCARSGWFLFGYEVAEWVYEDSVDEVARAQLIADKGEAQVRTPDYCSEWIAGEFEQILQSARNDFGYDWANWAGSRLTQIMDAARGGAAAITALEPAWVFPRTALADATSYVSTEAQALHTQAEAQRTRIVANTPDLGIVAHYGYERDPLGRIQARHEAVLGQVREHSYIYDSAGRLTAHDVDGTRTDWTFDANGNRTHENGTEIAVYDSEDRLVQWKDATYTYTPAGDLQSRTGPSGTTSYTYDALGSLHQVVLPGGTRIDYVIDPQGRRIGKKKNGALQYGLLYQDALNPIAELGPDGRIRSVFLYAEHAHAPAAMVRDGKLYRMVTDHLGSIRVVIDTDTGTIAQQLDYDVWGKVTLDTQPGFQPFGFAGGIYDPDTGLTRFGARDYDGETGRWTAKDPILFAGGDANLYGYVLQDPVNWVDPSGLWGVYGGTSIDIVGGYGFSLSGGGYIGTGGSGKFNGASPNVGAELGFDFEIGIYTGCVPPQAGDDYWGLDIDFGVLGVQLNAKSWDDFAIGLTFGPGTPGVTVNPGGPNVSF